MCFPLMLISKVNGAGKVFGLIIAAAIYLKR
jgi:hypothetical protein